MITGIWPLLVRVLSSSYVTFVLNCQIISCVAAQIRDDGCDTLYECWTLSNGAKIAWRTMADSPGYVSGIPSNAVLMKSKVQVDIQMTRPDSGDYSNSQYVALGWSTDAIMVNLDCA